MPAKRSSKERMVRNMYELVEVRGNEIFTTSKVIADGTNNTHNAIQKIITKYEKNLSRFGQVGFKISAVKYNRGTNNEKVYQLNEAQATLLMTLLRNDGTEGIVVKFKTDLVEQFIKMREHLLKKQSTTWIDTRKDNKVNRLKETDVIKLLIDYAKEQGSSNSDKLYMSYTKLANTIINCKREDAGVTDLNNLTLVESVILQTIRIDMSMQLHYKDIYKDCKNRIEMFKEVTYMNTKRIVG